MFELQQIGLICLRQSEKVLKYYLTRRFVPARC